MWSMSLVNLEASDMDYVLMSLMAFLIGSALMVNLFINDSQYFCIPDEEVTVEQARELDEVKSHLDGHTCFRVGKGGK